MAFHYGQNRVWILLGIFLSLVGNVFAQDEAIQKISGGGISLQVTADGNTTGTSAIGKFTVRAAAAECVPNNLQVRSLDGGAVEIVRGLEGPQGQTCQVTERFAPTTNGVRWTVAVEAEGEPWTTPITLGAVFDESAGMQFWRAGIGSEAKAGWPDPLKLIPLAAGKWIYGRGEGTSLPLASVFRSGKDAGLSLVCSPADLLLVLDLQAFTNGISFIHSQHRLGQGRRISFTVDLVAHAADWRGGLDWMTRQYPKFFDPPLPAVDAMAGCGAYSAFDEIPDAAKMKKMSFRMNWWAYFDWPYLGMNLPPMARNDEPWVCCDPYKTGVRREMTFDKLNDYARRMKAAGFFPLNYFTTTEFGTFMKGPEGMQTNLPEAELWKDCTSFAYLKIKDGMLLNKQGGPVDNGWKNGGAMDAGGPNYRAFLIEQAHRQVERLPEFSGVCIDRLDWLNQVNSRGDDGVSWYNNKPGRLVRIGWLNMMAEMAGIFHQSNKVIFANPCTSYRVEVAQYLDGIYDEFGHDGWRLNASALLCVRKPLMAWTPSKTTLGTNADAFFQRHLYMGAYPTVPYPKNNHTINPDPWAETQYMDYGPLLDAMRGKKWVLTPHCIEVVAGAAKANLFQVPGGWVIPVGFADGSKSVKILIRNVPGISTKLKMDALHPGVEKPQPVSAKLNGDALELEVPVHRGGAMVRLQAASQ
jgi:hypothetical protein